MGKLGGILIRIIKLGEKEYPEKLTKIKNPPKQLFIEGDLNLLNNNIISIIGSRSCTENGKNLARKFAQELVEQGIIIASGMAKRNRYICT